MTSSRPPHRLPTGFGLALAVAIAGCKADPAGGEGRAADSAMAREVSALTVGQEREVSPGVFMTMFRTGATAPTSDGWHRAAATEGGFSVEVPLPFNDFRVRSEAKDGVPMRTDTVGGKTPGRLSWLATCIARKDGSLGPGGSSPPPEGVQAMGDPPRAYQRTVHLPGRICVLVVEAQGEEPLASEADRNRFLQSFQVTGAPAW